MCVFKVNPRKYFLHYNFFITFSKTLLNQFIITLVIVLKHSKVNISQLKLHGYAINHESMNIHNLINVKNGETFEIYYIEIMQ